jgi:hypothetical protein
MMTRAKKTFWEELIAYSLLIQHGPHRKYIWGETQTRRQQGVLIILLTQITGDKYRDGQTDREQADLISLHLFFQNDESTLKNVSDTTVELHNQNHQG